VRGIPVRIRLAFWLWPIALTAAIRPLDGILRFVLLAFLVTLVHEWGHATALRMAGQLPSIELGGYGGVTYGQRRLGTGESVTVSLIGPVTTLVVVGIPAWLLSQVGTVAHSEAVAPWINDLVRLGLWWSLINLLPILPFDGGHIAERLLGRPATMVLGLSLSGYGCLWAHDHHNPLVGVLFGAVLALNLVACFRWERPSVAADIDFDWSTALQAGRHGGHGAHPAGRGGQRGPRIADFAAIERSIDEVEQLEAMAWSAVRAGRFGMAGRLTNQAADAMSPYLLAAVAAGADRQREALDRFEEGLFGGTPPPPDALAPLVVAGLLPYLADRLAALSRGPGAPALAVLQGGLHDAGLFGEAAAVGMVRLRTVLGDERARVCFEVACNLARSGVPDAALLRLTDAVEAGFVSGEILDLEPDLDSLRSLDAYQQVRSLLE
jgi:Zn-dependent protease